MANRQAFKTERVKRRLGQQDVDAAVDQRRHLLVIHLDHLLVRRGPIARSSTLPATESCALVGPIEPATNRGRWASARSFVDRAARTGHGRQVDVADRSLETVIGHRDRCWR